MLYDQALISMVYAEAYQATGKDNFRRVAKATIEYVLKDLSSVEGAFAHRRMRTAREWKASSIPGHMMKSRIY